jgi:hypothetical protein
MASGFTTWAKSSRLGQIRVIHTNNARSLQPQTRRRPPQGDVELMTEKQVLGFEPASRLEHGGDEHSERMQDHKHRSE